MTFIDTFYSLFKGPTEAYAISRDYITPEGDHKRAYLPSNYSGSKPGAANIVREVVADIGTADYGVKAVTAHLKGDHFLGVYPINPDSTVNFFALDFDAEVEAEARAAAKRQQTVFMLEAELPTYIERSRSGKGYHLWGFLETPVNAGELRFALAPFIENADTYDRMFPNQDGVSEAKPYGNLIALPLYGPNVIKDDPTGVFVGIDNKNQLVFIDDQKAYLSDVAKIPASDIQKLFESRNETYSPDLGGSIRLGDPEALDGIYKVVHKEVGCEWIRWCIENPTEVGEPEWYALACQFAQLTGGREMFHAASKDDPRYNVRVTDEKFDQALEQNKPHGCAYIRENLNGPECHCDTRFLGYGVHHPYDLAKVPFSIMLEQLKLEAEPEWAVDGLLEAFAHVKHVYKNPNDFDGVEYGIPELDKYTELRGNDFVVFSARPGRGKTAFMVDIAYRIASAGTFVYVYSMEMSKQQFWLRLLSRIAQVDGKRLQKGTLLGSEWKRIIRTIRDIKQNPLPILVDDTTYDSTDVVNKAAELIARHGYGAVLIDYLQMATNRENERNYDKVSRVCREYKLLAKGMHVPVLALAQMNREGEDLNEDSETLDSVLEGSGKIEQYADVIIFLLGLRRPGIVQRTLVLHKERHREAGHRIKLDFNQPVMTFGSHGKWSAIAATINNQQVTPQVPQPTKGFFA